MSKGEKALNIKLTNASPLKQPSAWLPLAMSLAAVGLILGHAAIFGVAFIAAALALASVFFTPIVELKEQGSAEERSAALVSAD